LDEPALIEIADAYYRRLGVQITAFLDDRTSAENVNRLQNRGIKVFMVPNSQDYAEGLYAGIAALIATDWLLLMTNDELLSLTCLLDVSTSTRRRSATTCIAMPRRWLMPTDDFVMVAEAPFMNLDYQFRLVRPKEVHFHDQIHTPGFDVPSGRRLLGAESCIYHFDWVLRSPRLRKLKLAFYETKMPGAQELYTKWYLPEEHPEDFTFAELTDPAVAGVVLSYRSMALR